MTYGPDDPFPELPLNPPDRYDPEPDEDCPEGDHRCWGLGDWNLSNEVFTVPCEALVQCKMCVGWPDANKTSCDDCGGTRNVRCPGEWVWVKPEPDEEDDDA